LKLTKCVFRSCNLWKISKELNMFLIQRITVMCTSSVVYRNIASVVASCNTNNFFSVLRFSIRRKKNLQKLNVFFLDQNRRNYRLYGIWKTNNILLFNGWNSQYNNWLSNVSKTNDIYCLMSVCLMVFNATVNNISVISWRSVLLVEEIGENHRPVGSRLMSEKQTT
jgi:hypothetical protein